MFAQVIILLACVGFLCLHATTLLQDSCFQMVRVHGQAALDLVKLKVIPQGDMEMRIPREKLPFVKSPVKVISEGEPIVNAMVQKVCFVRLTEISKLLSCPSFDYLTPYALVTEPYDWQMQLAPLAESLELHDTIFHLLKLLNNIDLGRYIFIEKRIQYSGNLFASSVPADTIANIYKKDRELGKAIFRYALEHQSHLIESYGWLRAFIGDEFDARELWSLIPPLVFSYRMMPFFIEKLGLDEFLTLYPIEGAEEAVRDERATPEEVVVFANYFLVDKALPVSHCGTFAYSRVYRISQRLKSALPKNFIENTCMLADERGDHVFIKIALRMIFRSDPHSNSQKAMQLAKALESEKVPQTILKTYVDHLRDEEIFMEPRWKEQKYDVAFDRVPFPVRQAQLFRRIAKNCSDVKSYEIKNLSVSGGVCVNGKSNEETSISDAVINRAAELLIKNELSLEEGQHLYVAVFYLLIAKRKLDFSRYTQFLVCHHSHRDFLSVSGTSSTGRRATNELTLDEMRELVDSSYSSHRHRNNSAKFDDLTN